MENNKIKTWAEADTPYGKLLNYGKGYLSDKELLSMIIKTGTKEKNCIAIAGDILNSVENDLTALARITIRDLIKFKGIGKVKAMGIMAAIELGWRRRLTESKIKAKISSSKNCYEIFRPMIGSLNHEEFWIAFLNRSNTLLSCKRLSSGGMSGTVVDPKIVFLMGIENKASNLILAHNHPSENLRPSDQDIKLTKGLVESGKLLELQIMDHLIICERGYFSFADEGML